MSTITTIAARYNHNADSLQTFADMHDVDANAELTEAQETFLVDLIENTNDGGVYHAK